MHRLQEGARGLLIALLILLFLVFSVEPLPSWATGLKSTSTSLFSFCVNGGDSVSTYYLVDSTNPIPGQSIMIEDYVQGRLILGGTYLFSPRVRVTTADGSKSASGAVSWGQIAHVRGEVYQKELGRLVDRLKPTSTVIVSVIPLGLTGVHPMGIPQRLDRHTMAPYHEGDIDADVHATYRRNYSSRWTSREIGSGLSWLLVRQSLPRLWPILMRSVQEVANRRASRTHARNATAQETTAPAFSVEDNKAKSNKRYFPRTYVISRFVASAMRFRVEVEHEEEQYTRTSSQLRTVRRAGVQNPDLSEGLLRPDLPLGYVSHIDYGHKIFVSANVSISMNSNGGMPSGLDLLSARLMRVVSGHLPAQAFQQMYPAHSIVARLRWDHEVPILPQTIAAVAAHQHFKYGGVGDGEAIWMPDSGLPWNASQYSCKMGSFRRSRYNTLAHKQEKALGSCPLADSWPSIESPWKSWMMHGGDILDFERRLDEWRDGLASVPETAMHAVPVAMKARKAPDPADTARMLEEFDSTNREEQEKERDSGLPDIPTIQKRSSTARASARIIQTHTGTVCVRWNGIPFSLVVAVGDVALILVLILLLCCLAWCYLVSGFCVSRVGSRLPRYLGLHAVPFHLHLLTFTLSRSSQRRHIVGGEENEVNVP